MNKELEQAIQHSIATLGTTAQVLREEYEALSDAACDSALSKEEFNTTSRILTEASGALVRVRDTQIRIAWLLLLHLKGGK